jgi:hypothetical protein
MEVTSYISCRILDVRRDCCWSNARGNIDEESISKMESEESENH